MLKKALIITTVLAILLSGLAFPISAAKAEGIDYAYLVKGGAVNNVEEFLAALTSESSGKTYGVYENGVIRLTASIVLKKPIEIKNGNYTLYGRGVTVYRGFSGAAMFYMSSNAETDIGLTLKGENATELQLKINGNSEEFPNESYGIVFMAGRTRLQGENVTFTNSSIEAYGGAIYAEVAETGYERTPLTPEISLKKCRIINCTAYAGGGAIAMNAYYSGTNSGSVALEDVELKGNKSCGADYYGYGGAIYSYGGEVKLNTVTLDANEADYGGAIYTCSATELNNCTLTNNKANVYGGAIHVDKKEGVIGGAKLEECTLSYNSSLGNGGAISNVGSLSIKGTLMIIESNTAEVNGGGVYNEGSFEMLGGSIMLNKAGYRGGAVYCKDEVSVLTMKSGEMHSNTAQFCGGLYSGGELVITNSAIGNNNSEFPQILLKGSTSLSDTALLNNDSVAICSTVVDGEKVYPYIYLPSKMTATVSVNISFCDEKLDKDGAIKEYKEATKGSMRILDGSDESIESARRILKVDSRGVLSYKIKRDGTLSVRFLFLPIWSWVIIALAVSVLCFVFRAKIVKVYKKIFIKKKNS